MAGMNELMREYERARFPLSRRLDVHGEGPAVARERALRWVQSRAHEAPGEELLLIVDRTPQPGRPPGAVERAVRDLLDELDGRLIDWWQAFTPGALALRIALEPTMFAAPPARPAEPEGDGRTEETAGAARPDPGADIPAELLPLAERAAELRIAREEHSFALMSVVLREVWIEAQALAMEQRLDFEEGLAAVVADEERLMGERGV